MTRISDLILYKDHHFIAINKPAGIPTQQDPSGDTSVHRMAMAYAHRDLHIVHRLDRRVSGVVVFAKTSTDAAYLSGQWKENHIRKDYLAMVPITEIPASGQLKHFLTYDQKRNVTEAQESYIEGADEAQMNYEIIQRLDHYMVLKIDLISGRKHQLRAQLAAIGCPIKGDIKYGSKRTNEDASIDLHARSIQFMHPTKKSLVKIEAPLPEGGLWEHVRE